MNGEQCRNIYIQRSIFSRTPKFPGSYPWGYAYPSLEYTVLDERSDRAPIPVYNNTTNNNNKLQLSCHPVAVVILHVYKT